MKTPKLLVILLLTIVQLAVAENSIKYFYYGLENRGNTDQFKGLKVICHGLNASSSVAWYDPIIQAYVSKGFSVLAVDWKDKADDGYIDAIIAASNVGQAVADELLSVRSTYGFQVADVHIIGHSLGAHIAGYVGKFVLNATGEKIGRITGLDPAGPGFYLILSSARLNSEDATFVDIIHTDTDLLGLGLSIGHADFYPDGGALQNSCSILDVGCSHNRVPDYFIESINLNNFKARKCSLYLLYTLGVCSDNNSEIMGDGCSSSASGDYYLTTNNQSPYGKG